jgi:arsenite methyltransferase
MLELRANCESCDCDLAPSSEAARICSFECPFCATCAGTKHHLACPNCGGELVRRPVRPAQLLAKFPPAKRGKIEPMEIESVVSKRYAQGAQCREESLCCPVSYDTELLALLPQEILERDYGCGDPSRYVRSGDVVVDLGSGGGKICYMAAQITGCCGHVHGIDMTDEMLELARSYQEEMADTLGFSNVDFRRGYIQNVAHIIEPSSVDLVISNCVLNLVAEADRRQMIEGIYQVLKPGGRIAIADIVSEVGVPEAMKQDAELWSGCISGAFQKEDFLRAFEEAGFKEVRYDIFEEEAWQEVQGLKFFSATVCAQK